MTKLLSYIESGIVGVFVLLLFLLLLVFCCRRRRRRRRQHSSATEHKQLRLDRLLDCWSVPFFGGRPRFVRTLNLFMH